jgi:hypothetical protein
MAPRMKEKSRTFCLIALTGADGRVVKTRSSFKQRLKVGTSYITVYELRSEDFNVLHSGEQKASLLERVSEGEEYVDRLTIPLKLYQLGSWCLTPERQ